MTNETDPEMVAGEIIAKRVARDVEARAIAHRSIPLWLLVFPAGTWMGAGVWPPSAGVSGVLFLVVAGWLMYSINRRFAALVALTSDAGKSD